MVAFWRLTFLANIHLTIVIKTIFFLQQNAHEQALAISNHSCPMHFPAVSRFRGSNRRQPLMNAAAAGTSSLWSASERPASIEITSPWRSALWSFMLPSLSHSSGKSSSRIARIVDIRLEAIPFKRKGAYFPVRRLNVYKHKVSSKSQINFIARDLPDIPASKYHLEREHDAFCNRVPSTNKWSRSPFFGL